MPKRTKKTLFFDFDGVIADTLHNTAKIHNEIMRQFGKEPIATPALIRENWNGWEHLYTVVYGFSKQELPHAIPIYREFISQEEPPKIFADMEDVIKKLATTDTLIIASSNYSPYILLTLEGAGLDKYFKSIYGKDELRGLDKSDPRFFQIPTDDLVLEKEDIVAIGDTAGEIEGAKRAGIPIIACSWGWQDRETLIAARPDYLADSPKELLSIVQK